MLLSQPLRRRLSSRCLALVLLALAVGLPTSARADGRWLLVSDIHLDPFDRSAAPATPGNDSNRVLLSSAIRAMRAADADPAVVVIAGDFLAHHFGALARKNRPGVAVAAVSLQTMASIEGAFATAFPHARFLIALGNNDDPCGDYRVSYRSAYLRALAKMWAPLVERANAAPGFIRQFGADGAYVAATPIAGLQAIVLNSVYWSPHYNIACAESASPGDVEMSWLQQTLADARPGDRAIAFMHIPPGIDGYSTAFIHGAATVPFLTPSISSRLVALLNAPRNHIAFALASHTHELQLRDLGAVPMLIVPSISPIYGRAPSFLLATMNRNGALTDYTGHVYAYRTASWDTYDFNRRFAVRGVNLASILMVHARMVAGWVPPAQAQTPSDRYAICAQVQLAVDGFQKCAGVPNRRLWVAVVLGLAALVAAFGWAILVLARRRREVV